MSVEILVLFLFVSFLGALALVYTKVSEVRVSSVAAPEKTGVEHITEIVEKTGKTAWERVYFGAAPLFREIGSWLCNISYLVTNKMSRVFARVSRKMKKKSVAAENDRGSVSLFLRDLGEHKKNNSQNNQI